MKRIAVIGLFALTVANIQLAQGAGWTNTVSMKTAREIHTATLLPNGKVLVAGGNSCNSPLSNAELYDPASGTWTNTGSMNSSRYYHTETLLPNGKVLVAGGAPITTNRIAELYDPSSGIWTVTGSISTGRYYHTATLLPNGKVLLAGGQESGGYPSITELYDPASGTWTNTGSMATPRLGHAATLLPNGKVLVTGGTTNANYFASVEVYDPASGTWTNTGFMNYSRAFHTATLLPNGKVLVTGGLGDPPSLALYTSAELYDPVSGTWAATGSMNGARLHHRAVLLPNGKVLVVAGEDPVIGGEGEHTTTELYDPATGVWTGAGAMTTGRQYHTATLLPNGKVLVTGGWNNGCLASAEIYDWDGDKDDDGDGQSNFQEYLAGTDPTNNASAFRILDVVATNNDLLVSWAAGGGRTNVVQSAPDLTGSYSNVSPNILLAGTGDVTTNYLDVSAATNTPARFYRIRLIP